jgi:hypothetical protein
VKFTVTCKHKKIHKQSFNSLGFSSLSDLFLSPLLLVFSSAILCYYIPLRVYCGGCLVLWVAGGDIIVAAAIVDGGGQPDDQL